MKNNKGFTMVEIIATTAIIAIVMLMLTSLMLLFVRFRSVHKFKTDAKYDIVNNFETGQSTSLKNGNFSFSAGGKTFTVSGKYESGSYIVEEDEIIFKRFIAE